MGIAQFLVNNLCLHNSLLPPLFLSRQEREDGLGVRKKRYEGRSGIEGLCGVKRGRVGEGRGEESARRKRR